MPANQPILQQTAIAPATRTISGDSDGDDGASSGFLLALRRIRIRSGGVLLSSHRPPSHPPLHGNSWRDSTRCCRCCVCRFLRQGRQGRQGRGRGRGRGRRRGRRRRRRRRWRRATTTAATSDQTAIADYFFDYFFDVAGLLAAGTAARRRQRGEGGRRGRGDLKRPSSVVTVAWSPVRGVKSATDESQRTPATLSAWLLTTAPFQGRGCCECHVCA